MALALVTYSLLRDPDLHVAAGAAGRALHYQVRRMELRDSVLQNFVQPVPLGEDRPPAHPDRAHEKIDLVPAAHQSVGLAQEPDKEHADRAGVGEDQHQGGGEYFETALAELYGCLVIMKCTIDA